MIPSLDRMVNWGERHLKTDLRYLAAGGFWLSAGQVIYSLSAFVLALALANILPKETYGIYKYVLSISAIFSIFTLPGIITALSRASAQGFNGSLRYAVKERVRIGLTGLLLGLLFSAYYYHAGNSQLAMSIFIIAIFLPLFDPFNSYVGYLAGAQRFKENVVIALLTQLCSVLIMIATALYTQNLIALLVAYFLPYTILRYIVFRYIASKIPLNAPVDPTLKSYGVHLSAINVLSQVATQADDIILFHFLGPAAVAVYSVAIAPTEQVRGFLGAINTLLFPRLAQYTEDTVRKSLARKMILSFLGILIIILFYVFIVPFFFRIFFPRYVDAIPYSQIFALSLLYLFAAPASSFLQAHAKVREQYAINIFSSIFQLAAMMLGVIYFGIWGLVTARIISRFVGSITNVYFAYRS